MRVVMDDLWFCTDCTMAAVNDDYTGLDYHYDKRKANERAIAIRDGLKSLSRRGEVVSDYDSISGDGMREFSSARCDCCGTWRAGEKHRFAVLA